MPHEYTKIKAPRSLKKLHETDLIQLPDHEGNLLVVTKQETAKVIREYVDAEIGKLKHAYIADQFQKLEDFVGKEIEKLGGDTMKYLDYRLDQLAEKIAERLATRAFNSEVEKRVAERLAEEKLKKSKKGFI